VGVKDKQVLLRRENVGGVLSDHRCEIRNHLEVLLCLGVFLSEKANLSQFLEQKDVPK
jgi:hypothetical protein